MNYPSLSPHHQKLHKLLQSLPILPRGSQAPLSKHSPQALLERLNSINHRIFCLEAYIPYDHRLGALALAIKELEITIDEYISLAGKP